MSTFTTAHLDDGRYVDVPANAVSDWQYEVQNLDTTFGLAAWYTEHGDENTDEIQGTVDDDTRCDHDELTHRVTNESQIGEYRKDKPCCMARVCHRRACILDALAWVERNTGERAAWAAPHQNFSFDVPRNIPEPEPAKPPVSSGSQLTAVMADHDRGPQYSQVECIGEDLTCKQTARIEDSKNLTEDEITARLNELGWSVTPTLCPGHNRSKGHIPLIEVSP
ncbi:UNVERIFIED_ORG: hypothetical protein ABIB52_000756 [Arthrobacter sp. UYCu721]